MNQIVDIIGYEILKRMHTIQYNVTSNLTRTEIERNRKIKVETFFYDTIVALYTSKFYVQKPDKMILYFKTLSSSNEYTLVYGCFFFGRHNGGQVCGGGTWGIPRGCTGDVTGPVLRI